MARRSGALHTDIDAKRSAKDAELCSLVQLLDNAEAHVADLKQKLHIREQGLPPADAGLVPSAVASPNGDCDTDNLCSLVLMKLNEPLAGGTRDTGHKPLPGPSGHVQCSACRTAHERRARPDHGLHGGDEPRLALQGGQVGWPSAKDLHGKQYLLIEYCCSPGSVLGQTAPCNALVVRCTESADYTRPELAQPVLALIAEAVRLHVPVALWASIPCTGGSQLQNANIARYGVTEKLKSHWKTFRKLWKVFRQLADAVLAAQGLVAIEWPVRCKYWHDSQVMCYLKKARYHKAVADGCMFGLQPQREHESDEFLSKAWRVSTTCAGLAAALDRRCNALHQHVVTEGKETAATAYYPEQFAAAVHGGLELWAQSRADYKELNES